MEKYITVLCCFSSILINSLHQLNFLVPQLIASIHFILYQSIIMHFQSTTILAFFAAAATLVATAPPRTKDFTPNCGTATMTNTCVRDEGVYCTIDGSGHPFLYAPAHTHPDCLSVGTGGKCSCVGKNHIYNTFLKLDLCLYLRYRQPSPNL
jgi:hypothetical protein